MIGILTLQDAVNYGAVLQAYAMQQKLDDMQLENEIVNYECQRIREWHKVRFSIKNPIGFWVKMRTKKKFQNFMGTQMRCSERFLNGNQIKGYDTYLVGSDQVWNPDITGKDMTYYLDFADESCRKYSYAASLGPYRFTDQGMQKQCMEYLRRFQGISVREISGGRYLENLMKESEAEMQINVHLDPVFLLEKHQWQTMAEYPKQEGYILLYMIGLRPELILAAQKLSERTKLPVLWVSDSMRMYRGIRQKRCSNPQEFVGMFLNSAYVVTNSFHGTAFSILFHKQFYTVDVQDGKRRERIADLLELLELEGCVVDYIAEDIPVEWGKIDERIAGERKRAENYLERII